MTYVIKETVSERFAQKVTGPNYGERLRSALVRVAS
jgi:hypothetical protein